MRKGAILTFAMSLAMFLAVSATGQQPPGEKGGGKGGPGGKGGGFGGMRMPTPGEVLPAFVQERLKLTDDQKKQVADLQKDVDAKVDKLLTDEQKAEFKKMKEQRGGFGGGGFGGPGGGKGGKGGFGGGRGKDKN